MAVLSIVLTSSFQTIPRGRLTQPQAHGGTFAGAANLQLLERDEGAVFRVQLARSHHPRPDWWDQNNLIHDMNLPPGAAVIRAGLLHRCSRGPPITPIGPIFGDFFSLR